MSTDYMGLAAVIAAGASAVVTVGTFLRQGQMQRAGKRRDVKIEELHQSVNGQSEKLNTAISEAARSAGHAEGMVDERANPMAPSDAGPVKPKPRSGK